MANLIQKIIGTTANFFKVDTGGFLLKNSSGTAQIRNSADDDFARVQAKSATNDDDLTTKSDMDSAIAAHTTMVLRGDGFLRTITGLDPTLVTVARTINSVKILRQDAGSSGTTTIDVNKNGTTIFTTQANRPSVTYTDGDNATDSGTPDITSLAIDDIISFDIDSAETDAQTVVVHIKFS